MWPLRLTLLFLSLLSTSGQDIVAEDKVAEDKVAEDLSICEDLGREAGEFAFRGPCSTLKLVCPPPSASVTGSDESIDDQEKEPPSGLSDMLLEDAVESSCQLIFSSFCKRASVTALFRSEDEACIDILTNPPAFLVPNCPSFEAAVGIFRNELQRTCDMMPEFVRNTTEVIVSKNRPAFQSTTISGRRPSLVVDGNLRTRDCASTGFRDNEMSLETTNPWWAVDLSAVWSVTRIIVVNNEERDLSNFEIRVGDIAPFGYEGGDPSADNPICAQNVSINAGGLSTFECPMRGRYVVIRIPGNGKVLSLCEVQVLARGGEEPALLTAPLLSRGKPTFQVSTLGNSVSEKAVDGNTDADFSAGSCTHTGFDSRGSIQMNPWWAVDLGSSQNISLVKITNRSDCCETRLKNFEIRVGDDRPDGAGDQNEICAAGTGIPRGQTFQYECDAFGRYVMVRIPNRQAILTLCEVEVFG